MDIEIFEKREQILALREKVLQAEQERMEGTETLSVADTRKDYTKLFLNDKLKGLSGNTDF